MRKVSVKKNCTKKKDEPKVNVDHVMGVEAAGLGDGAVVDVVERGKVGTKLGWRTLVVV